MKIHLIATFFLCFSWLLFAQESNDNAVLKEHIRQLDLAHAQAIFEGDAASLERLMDDEVTVNHPTNQIVKEKKGLLDLINNDVIRYTTFEWTPETFLFYQDLEIVMGSEIVTPAEGAPNANKKLQRRYTNIWMKHNGECKLNARHANNLCE